MNKLKSIIKKCIIKLPSKCQVLIYKFWYFLRAKYLNCFCGNRCGIFSRSLNRDIVGIDMNIKTNIKVLDKNKLQKLIDSLSYPPTHEYKIDGLIPTGVLKDRLNMINNISPNFFSGQQFLDVGCNKGFFSLLASQKFNQVVSIDNDLRFTELCTLLKQDNMKVFQSPFRDFIAENQFDRILIGNTHHYLFVDSGGWDWLCKLAAITSPGGLVIIEGPVDMKCKDMEPVIPESLRKEFNFETFKQNMEHFFVLEKMIPTISYTPDRFLMLFSRKQDGSNTAFQFNDLSVNRILKEDENSIVFLTSINSGEIVTAKVMKSPTKDMQIKINLASFSPISNGAVGIITYDDKVVGWLETYNASEIYKYNENQKELFGLICDHMVFLSRNGYFDGDCATINFFKNNNKLFDKGLVLPIKEIDESVYKNFQGRGKGSYFIHLENSYDFIKENNKKSIYHSLESKNSHLIEQTFREIKASL